MTAQRSWVTQSQDPDTYTCVLWTGTDLILCCFGIFFPPCYQLMLSCFALFMTSGLCIPQTLLCLIYTPSHCFGLQFYKAVFYFEILPPAVI